jgi:hypothetical protein
MRVKSRTNKSSMVLSSAFFEGIKYLKVMNIKIKWRILQTSRIYVSANAEPIETYLEWTISGTPIYFKLEALFLKVTRISKHGWTFRQILDIPGAVANRPLPAGLIHDSTLNVNPPGTKKLSLWRQLVLRVWLLWNFANSSIKFTWCIRNPRGGIPRNQQSIYFGFNPVNLRAQRRNRYQAAMAK